MDKLLCKCGCGSELPEKNKTGYKWGHKPKADAVIPPVLEIAQASEPEEGLEVYMTGTQIERVWQSLPLRLRAIAILSALNYEEPEEEKVAA